MTKRPELPKHWIGLASELAVAPEGVVLRRADDAIAVHFPARRSFFDLNALWPVGEPTEEEVLALLSTWHDEFEDAGLGARILCWEEEGAEEPADSPWPSGSEVGDFRVSLLSVLQRDGARPTPAPSAEFSVRPVEDDAEWDCVVELNLAVHGYESGPEADFCRWMLGERHRGACEEGLATWWAVWDGDEAIASAGLYEPPDARARFQEIVTHPDHRCRGACTSLLATILGRGTERGFLLIAQYGSEAERIYRRFGFRPVSRIRELFERLPD